MRKFSAHYIFPVASAPVKFGTLVCEDSGEIVDLIDTFGVFVEKENLEFYDGIIVPGFISETIQSPQAILDRMKTMQYQYPSLNLDGIIRWATLDAAKKSNLERDLGSFEKNKCPGVYLIDKIDFKLMKLTEVSIVKILMPQKEFRLF